LHACPAFGQDGLVGNLKIANSKRSEEQSGAIAVALVTRCDFGPKLLLDILQFLVLEVDQEVISLQ